MTIQQQISYLENQLAHAELQMTISIEFMESALVSKQWGGTKDNIEWAELYFTEAQIYMREIRVITQTIQSISETAERRAAIARSKSAVNL